MPRSPSCVRRDRRRRIGSAIIRAQVFVAWPFSVSSEVVPETLKKHKSFARCAGVFRIRLEFDPVYLDLPEPVQTFIRFHESTHANERHGLKRRALQVTMGLVVLACLAAGGWVQAAMCAAAGVCFLLVQHAEHEKVADKFAGGAMFRVSAENAIRFLTKPEPTLLSRLAYGKTWQDRARRAGVFREAPCTPAAT